MRVIFSQGKRKKGANVNTQEKEKKENSFGNRKGRRREGGMYSLDSVKKGTGDLYHT